MFSLHSVPLGRLVVLLVDVGDSWRWSSERFRSPFVAEIAPVPVRVRESINEVLGEKLAELFEREELAALQSEAGSLLGTAAGHPGRVILAALSEVGERFLDERERQGGRAWTGHVEPEEPELFHHQGATAGDFRLLEGPRPDPD